MNNLLTQIIILINAPVNALGKSLQTPITALPGWLSNTIISAVTGVLLMVIFKYTSNQRAVGQARDNISANMLALRLFKDSILVTLQVQGRVFKGALLLLLHSIRPMLVMIVPVSLLLGQLGLWYQYQPLQPGRHAIVTMQLNGAADLPWPKVSISPASAFEVTVGPSRISSERQICWEIKARKNGYHNIVFHVDENKLEKQLAIGDNFMRTSPKRPTWRWADVLLHPLENPFAPDSSVQSISIDYPERLSKTSGTDWWVIYFFIASMAFALICKPFLKVRI